MFDGRTHKASKRWMLPEGPYRFILHLVTRGNIFVIGSSLMFWSFSTSATTFGPYELNSFPRNTSVKYILPSTTTKFANSAKTYCAAHATWCPLDCTKYRARAVVCEHFSYLSSGNRFIYKKRKMKRENSLISSVKWRFLKVNRLKTSQERKVLIFWGNLGTTSALIPSKNNILWLFCRFFVLGIDVHDRSLSYSQIAPF